MKAISKYIIKPILYGFALMVLIAIVSVLKIGDELSHEIKRK